MRVDSSAFRELLKDEIDRIQDHYIDALCMVIKALEYPAVQKQPRPTPISEAQWHIFLNRMAASCADAPLQRGAQGQPEEREALL
ncbi:hypothetical protein CSB45_08675 [candidate division KSB3 bacterium]|uniref:Uncharacterized protein n=1 Tax=candidate division KSB3 bacterium TaxID=2044937 RepID=A0A2G6E5C3_9BACT|nr:MAG: hypothetical protein CSB45_08675 [candidate division KSB3 bacterium]PIE29705.1 MAG: hypothetical protein CSA57_07760 [candidate division KSB3 bacterium]